jgi:DNA-binding SARP family transcriptional activator
MQLEAASAPEAVGPAHVNVRLLGGFYLDRDGLPVSDFAWQRRSARRLTKLLASTPSHSLHREQILEIFWPDADPPSARNSLAKALHAARHALEPGRGAREGSAYLRVREDMIMLDPDHVVVDVDSFQRLAQEALRYETLDAYEAALAAYTGVLLPEDLYEDWTTARRLFLSELHVQCRLGLAETRADAGAYLEAIDCLQGVLYDDPTREDVHRRVMRLYCRIGARGLALRQYNLCRDALRAQLDVDPDRETSSLYEVLIAQSDDEHEVSIGAGRSGIAAARRV